MGYEFGFCKKSAEESSEYYDLKDFYFDNYGLEYENLFKAFTKLGKNLKIKMMETMYYHSMNIELT